MTSQWKYEIPDLKAIFNQLSLRSEFSRHPLSYQEFHFVSVDKGSETCRIKPFLISFLGIMLAYNATDLLQVKRLDAPFLFILYCTHESWRKKPETCKKPPNKIGGNHIRLSR